MGRSGTEIWEKSAGPLDHPLKREVEKIWWEILVWRGAVGQSGAQAESFEALSK